MRERVVIISAWTDDNKGDAGILLGLIHLIRQSIPEDKLRLDLISHFHSSDSDFDHYHRFVKMETKGNATLHSAILSKPVRQMGNRLLYQLYMLKAAVVSLVILLIAPILVRSRLFLSFYGAKGNALAALHQSDVVLYKGGHEIYTQAGIGSTVAFYIRIFPLLLALRLGCKVVIYGQSIGPVDGIVARWLLRFSLARCSKILVREPQSHAYIEQIAGKSIHGRSGLTWDTGFLVESERLPEEIRTQLPERFVACTLRPWSFPDTPNERHSKYANYLYVMAAFLSRLQQDYGLPVVLAPQVIGPSSQVSDYTAWDDLNSYFDTKYMPLMIRADLSPGQLVTLYEHADFVIGTRFHSVIFAIVACTPGLAISYHGYKTTGIMQMLGLDDYVVDIDGIDVEKLWSAFLRLAQKPDQLRKQLEQHMGQIKRESLATAVSVLAAERIQPYDIR